MNIKLIGAAIDKCAGIPGAAGTPDLLNEHLQDINEKVDQIIRYNDTRDNVPLLTKYYTDLAMAVKDTLDQKQVPVVIGGDHSCAIGTWSGVSGYLSEHDQTLGLIWIDAHMDSHTPESSISGNIHGMPVATLLGYGFDDFIKIINANPKIKPENIVQIGIRSYEDAEEALLKKLGVKIYYNYDVIKNGFAKVFNEAWNYLADRVDKIGLSIDVDGFDPEFAPGVGTAVPEGVDFNHFMAEYTKLDVSKVVAVEITEANAKLDQQNKTIDCVIDIIKATKNLY